MDAIDPRSPPTALLKQQRPDGHWVYELEADATIPAEYVLLVHYLAEKPNLELERKIGVYLRRIQGAHGGWPLYHGGAVDISATVKAYFALKMIGDDPDAPHMVRAREEILKRGGADKANVFTRILMALYGQTSWMNVPTVPVELILLPRWFPIHLSKMSYWARTVIVPLLVLAAKKPLAKQSARRERARTLSAARQVASKRAPHQKWHWSVFFGALDWVLKRVEPLLAEGSAPARHRRMRALDHRAAQRRRRVGRDLSRHGQQRDDVRHHGRAARRSAPRHRAQIRREAAGGEGRTKPIASLASRRCGTRRWSATP